MIALKSLAVGSQEDLLKEFGFDSKKVTFEAEHFLGKQIKVVSHEDSSKKGGRLNQPPVVTENPFANDLDNLSQEGAFDFFNKLGNQPQPQKKEEEIKQQRAHDTLANEASPHAFLTHQHDPSHLIHETVSRNANWNEGVESLIKKNLLIGNLQYAAEIALKCGRTTTALLIAERGGPDLFNEIKQSYFELEKDAFIASVVRSINEGNLSRVTDASLLGQAHANPALSATTWKESLSYLFSYFAGSLQERNQIIKQMGDVLLEQRDISAAIVCYALSQNVKEVLDIWKRRAIHHIQRKEETRELALADLLQKFILMKLALEESSKQKAALEANDDFNQVLAEVAGYLTSDEQCAISFMKYLTTSKSASLEVQLIRDRIYRAHEVAMYGRAQQPSFPLPIERIRVQGGSQRQQVNSRRQANAQPVRGPNQFTNVQQ